jgi:hypothetical protein
MSYKTITKEEEEYIEDMRIFLKDAFCISGECKFIEYVKISSDLKDMVGMLFELEDLKRGVFYITLSK